MLLNLIIFGFAKVIYSDKLNSLFNFINKFRKIICIILGTSCTIDTLSIPVRAQFFGKAEDFFKNVFTGEDTANMDVTIALVFNIFRALVILYLAVALIGVVEKMRRDEDWQTAARAPLIILVVLTLGDSLSAMIIGNTPGGKPEGDSPLKTL